MAGGPLRGVAVIDRRLQADVKSDAVVISGGNVFQSEIGFAVACADIGEPIILFQAKSRPSRRNAKCPTRENPAA